MNKLKLSDVCIWKKKKIEIYVCVFSEALFHSARSNWNSLKYPYIGSVIYDCKMNRLKRSIFWRSLLCLAFDGWSAPPETGRTHLLVVVVVWRARNVLMPSSKTLWRISICMKPKLDGYIDMHEMINKRKSTK